MEGGGGKAPVHVLILSASCFRALSLQGDVVGRYPVTPPQLAGHTPVPDVLQPPAPRQCWDQANNDKLVGWIEATAHTHVHYCTLSWP